jgi:hypothetical protein
MTHSVAAIASAATTAETKRTQAARSTGISFAEVQAAAVKTTEAKDSTSTSTSTSTDDKTKASTSAPKGERTQKVEGHNYVEIVAGPRNGMFINNTGSRRDGEAFVIVKRHGREFHVYGSGDDRKVYEVGRKRETTDAKDTSGTTDTKTSGTSGTSTTGTTSTT